MKKVFLYIVASLLIWAGCKEEERIDFFSANTSAPLPIEAVSVTPRHGGAVLKYQIPRDENIICVKAVYEINPGQLSEVKSSIYLDSLVLQGFATEETMQVKVLTVGRNGKESTPLLVDVTPLTPVVMEVASNCAIKETIGGVKISYAGNDYKDNLVYVLLAQNPETDEWNEVRKFYSGLEKGSHIQRGMDAVETNVGLYITDRWGHSSDTIFALVTPIFEEEVPKPFAHKEGLWDKTWTAGGPNWGIECLWDGRWDHKSEFAFITTKSSTMPQTFVIDLKRKVEITRIVAHQRPEYTYIDTSVKEFELWGTCVDSPNVNADHPDWINLGRFSSYPPSGQIGNPTPEDAEYANVQGEEFEFLDEVGDPKPTKPVRYLRWSTYETWNGATEVGEVIISEIEVYGKIVDE